MNTEEIEKTLAYIERMEAIIRSSPNASQVDRIKKEMRKYSEKLAALVPGTDPGNIRPEEIRAKLKGNPGSGRQSSSSAAAQGSSGSQSFSSAKTSSTELGYSILDKYPIEKASPNSTDSEINRISTILRVLQREYFTALSDQHTKLDFSHSAEREALRNQLDNVMRHLKVLAETIEEYSLADKQDFREQLLKMKHRQSRVFMLDTNEFFKKLKVFMSKLTADVRSNGGIIVNKDEVIRFDKKYTDATALEGMRVAEAIKEMALYTEEAIQTLRMPDLR